MLGRAKIKIEGKAYFPLFLLFYKPSSLMASFYGHETCYIARYF